MSGICIVTDSTASLPAEIVAKYGIKVIPLGLNFGNESFRDGVDITSDEFLRRLKIAKQLPTTSQPAIGDFVTMFEEIVPNCESIIVILLGSKFSGTYSSALTAAEMFPQCKISVVDSLSTYMGLGFMVQRAAEAVVAGQGHDEIVAMVEAMVPKMHIILALDTLEYLRRGGRIGGGMAFVGGLLNIKPLLQIKDGQVEPLERVRSKKKADQRLIEILARDVAGKPAHVVLGGVDNPEEIAEMEAMVKEQVKPVEFQIVGIGPVLSTHTGPGVVGLVYYTDLYQLAEQTKRIRRGEPLFGLAQFTSPV